jgi:hypothetical protein
MTDEPRLRVVGDDERQPEKAGSIAVVLEDLGIAHGHVHEARAELVECDHPAVPTIAHELMLVEAKLAAAMVTLRGTT